MVSPQRKLLIVDDETDICSSSQSFFGKRGFEVSTTGDGEQALKMIESWKPDLVLLDLTLNYSLSGKDVLKKIRETNKELNVFIVSANENEELIDELYSIGINGYYHKPFKIEEIEQAVYEKLGIDPKNLPNNQSGELNSSIPKSKGSLHQIANKLNIILGKASEYITDSEQGFNKHKTPNDLLNLTVKAINDVQDHTGNFVKSYEDSILKQKAVEELLKMNVEYLNHIVQTVDYTMKILEEEAKKASKVSQK